MATNEIKPVATPVATAPNPVLTSVTPEAVYSPTNIQQIDVPSTKKVMDMKLSSLEKKLAKANSIQELNQIGIMNQPKAMGVLTGEAAYRSKLDTARINAFNSLYNTRLAEEQRKEAERQQFIQTYGADPKSRPKGMSKKEFAKAIQGGKFSDLLTEDFKQKQLQTLAAQKSLAGGSGSGSGSEGTNLQAEIMNLKDTGVSWGDAAAIVERKYGMMPGDEVSQVMDWVYGGIKPTPQLTATERLAQDKAQKDEQESMDMANAAIPELEKKIKLLNDVTGRGVGAGFTGWVERNLGVDITGGKANNVTRIQAIIGKETLDTLLNLKARGGTLGAISEKELSILQASANRIGAAEVKDKNGNTVGYRISESEFDKEIQNMKTAAQRVLDEARKKAGIQSQGAIGNDLSNNYRSKYGY
jgi:hypothetical protein